MKRFMLLLACLMMTAGIAMAQSSRKVMGVVSSAETGQPIQGARVFVNGTSYGAITDAEGTFVIPSLPSKYKMLTVSFFGKQTENVAVSSKMNILLKDNQQVLDEAVVIAYGTAKKSEFTGAVGTMKSENLEKMQVSDVTNALAGNVAGVQAHKSNGQPGTSSSILVRGVGSINASTAPLYVVDGVPFEGDISTIPTQDIESVSIEKDAAASALYGARSGNGVIIITTKKGKQGNARVTFDMKLGQNSRQIKNYDVLQTPGAYTEKVYEALYNGFYYTNGQTAAQAHANANEMLMSGTDEDGGFGYKIYTVPEGEMLIGVNGKLNPNATLGYNTGENLVLPDNWEKNTFKNNLRQEYNANITGGNSKLTYYASFNHLNDQGIIQNSDYKRYNFRTAVDYQINDWLKVGTNVGYTYSNSRYPDEQTETNSSGNAFNIAYTIAPVYSFWVRDAQGNIMRNAATGNKVYDYGSIGYGGIMDRSFQPGANPAGQLVYDKTEYLTDNVSLNNYVQITPLKGLTITGRMGATILNQRANFLLNPFYGQFAEINGAAEQAHERFRSTDYQLLGEYRTTFNDVHHMGLLLGYDGYNMTTDDIGGSAQGLYDPTSYWLYNAIDQKNVFGYHNEYSTQGYFFRGNYDYADKYFGSFSIRRDGSSRFHKDNRWGTFWSASAAWMMTKEDFMKPLTWLDELKIRGSFGQQGNDNLGSSYLYAYADRYRMTGSNGVFSDGTLQLKGNKDLKWEKSNSWNFGFDFSVLKRKLFGSVEYYNRQTSNMLYFKTVGGSAGYTSIPMNIGKMRNNGVEFDLNSELVKNKDVTLTLNLNATFQGNKILKLHPDLNGEWIDGSRIYREGKSMYSLYLTKWAGVAKSDFTSNYQAWATDDDGNQLVDANGDPYLEDKTLNVQGGQALYWAKDDAGNEYQTTNWSTAYNSNRYATKSLLPKVYGGFGATITFFGFDASFQMAYSLGGKIFDSGYQSFMHNGYSSYAGQNWHKDILKSWSPSNPNSNIPRVNAQERYANSTSDRFLKSADYFNLNNVQIGYTLPQSLTNQLTLQKVRIYVAGDNLFLISSRRGLDPRRSFVSSTTLTYSPIRTISGGLTVTF